MPKKTPKELESIIGAFMDALENNKEFRDEIEASIKAAENARREGRTVSLDEVLKQIEAEEAAAKPVKKGPKPPKA